MFDDFDLAEVSIPHAFVLVYNCPDIHAVLFRNVHRYVRRRYVLAFLSDMSFLVILQVFIDHLLIFRVDRPFPVQDGREAFLLKDAEYLARRELGFRQGTRIGVFSFDNLSLCEVVADISKVATNTLSPMPG